MLHLFCKTWSIPPNFRWSFWPDSFSVCAGIGFEVCSISCFTAQLSALVGYFDGS